MSKQEIKILNVDEVVETDHSTWEEQGQQLHNFLHTNNAWYYGKPAEDFSIHEALAEAEANGKAILVVDNLS